MTQVPAGPREEDVEDVGPEIMSNAELSLLAIVDLKIPKSTQN